MGTPSSARTFSIEKAEEAQRRLGARVKYELLPVFPPRTVAGVDIHYRGSVGLAAIALCECQPLRLLTLATIAASRAHLDYIPGFLAFREAPLVFKALRSFERPDVLLVNGHGVSHPRGCGLATHVGVIKGIPTIGVALKPLSGANPNSCIEVEHSSGKLYVSVGNLITLDQSVEVLRRLLIPNVKLPLPLYLAHQAAQLVARWNR